MLSQQIVGHWESFCMDLLPEDSLLDQDSNHNWRGKLKKENYVSLRM